jgi:hypothetical protein
MKQYIKATILNMSQSEILEIVPGDTIERLKKSDPAPEFRVYCVGHEGDAHAQELSFGGKISKAFNYVKDMIVRIAEKIQYGTPLYHLHAGMNTGDGREKLGEVVGKAVKNIAGKISAVAAIYLYPQYRKMQLDVASIEADIVYIPKGESRGDVIDVQQVTGIALASSATEKPAFPGATLLGVIQALQGAETMTKEEIREAIRELKLKPMDVFERADIIESDPYKDLETKKKNEEAFAKRKEKDLSDEHEKVIDLQKKLDETSGKVKTLTEKVNTSTSRTLIDASITARKLDAKSKAFIERNSSQFKSDKEGEELKQDVERFVDGQIKELEAIAKDLGVEIKKEPVPAAGAGSPAADGAAGGTSKDDLEDPAKNDFIPKD